ncbi:unnamed protein product [Arabidopsis arenosa]|uniref:Uncharacterized protein n=1 Tax=Arabidopsis arenosa TaxID=38785 RepID=A0A8S2A2F7_ARAAE|nr:unnamed protein product [Arabidopsis arenosa]
MSGTDSQVSHNEDLSAPPPLGPELASGKWRVRVVDGDAKITEEMISGKEVWSMLNRRVIVDFNRRGQPIKDSGGKRVESAVQSLKEEIGEHVCVPPSSTVLLRFAIFS